MAKKPSFAYSIVIIIVSQWNSLALRNYVILLDEFKCNVYGNYALSNLTCTPMDIEVQLKKEIQRPFFDLAVYWKLPNRGLTTIFKANRIDYCAWKRHQNSAPILKAVTDMVEKSGKLPDSCPIAANYNFRFINFTVDANYFPVYAPKLALTGSLTLYNRKELVLNINVTGRIKNKSVKKNKSRKIS